MVEKYGPPEWIQPGRLEWGTRWPWKRISVDVARPSRPLEQVVDYDVPTSKVGDLRRFPHGLIVYYEEGELAARSDREELNCLTLNLADDIVSGRMTPAQADGFFRSAVRLAAAGKSSAYMDRLIFDASRKVRGPGNPAH
jgi:hypothetical protein